MLLQALRIPFAITAIALIATMLFAGPQIALVVAILTILEVSLSFDNAVVNAKVLGKMDAFWQKMFLTVGVVIAVFGMRLVFPILVVTIAAHLGPLAVIHMALYDSGAYAAHLMAAHGVIAAFGGMFLLLLFLDFLTEPREVQWLPVERFAFGHSTIAKIIAFSVIGVLLFTVGETIAFAALLGLLTYYGVNWLSGLFETDSGDVKTIAKAGLVSFLYLEVLDASFSFDGVTGAFAISDQVLVIALGLGLGALYVRSLTVYLVRAGKLSEYRYLEHGAHWAIGALAVLLFVSIGHEVPEVITGLIGVGFIITAFVHSILKNKEEAYVGQESPSSSLS